MAGGRGLAVVMGSLWIAAQVAFKTLLCFVSVHTDTWYAMCCVLSIYSPFTALLKKQLEHWGHEL